MDDSNSPPLPSTHRVGSLLHGAPDGGSTGGRVGRGLVGRASKLEEPGHPAALGHTINLEH